MLKLKKSNEFQTDVIVFEPAGAIKKRSKIKVTMKIIGSAEYLDLLEQGAEVLLEEVLISVDEGVEMSEEMREEGLSLKDAVMLHLPTSNAIIRKYGKEVDGSDGKNSKRRR